MGKPERCWCAQIAAAAACSALATCLVLPGSSVAGPPGLAGEDFDDWTPQTKADMWRTLLVGPIDGLTTDWHPIPDQCAVPVGTILTLKYKAGDGAQYDWDGAIELEGKSGPASVAICPLLIPGQQTVNLTVMWNGQQMHASCELNVIPMAINEMKVTSEIIVDPDTLEINETLPQELLNASTIEHYFGDSIADVVQIGAFTYRTTIDKNIPVGVTVSPPEMAPLVEWRVNGMATGIGAELGVAIDEPGWHQISVGTIPDEKMITVQTYEVFITSHQPDDLIPTGQPVVFTAVTSPQGFEDEIVWLSSTKFGTAETVVGAGPVFVTSFNDTWGSTPDDSLLQWLGVKAGQATHGQDQKCEPGSGGTPDPVPMESGVTWTATNTYSCPNWGVEEGVVTWTWTDAAGNVVVMTEDRIAAPGCPGSVVLTSTQVAPAMATCVQVFYEVNCCCPLIDPDWNIGPSSKVPIPGTAGCAQLYEAENDAKRFCPNDPGPRDDEICNVSWDYEFDRSVVGGKVFVKVRVHLEPQEGVTPAELDAKKQAWEPAIEGLWSGAAVLNKTAGPGSPATWPINVDVCWVEASDDPHYTVRVFDSLPRRSMTRWSCNMPNNTAVHEFGHMLGAFDEYAGGKGFRPPDQIQEKPPGEDPTQPNSVMGNINGNAEVEHFLCVQNSVADLFPDCTFTTSLVGGGAIFIGDVVIPIEGDHDPDVFTIICPP